MKLIFRRRAVAVIVKAPGQSFLVLLWETRVQFPVTAFTITLVKLVVASRTCLSLIRSAHSVRKCVL